MTSRPDDRGTDDIRANSPPGPIRDRSHLARQIASLWDEPDAATRCALLAAFAFRNATVFSSRIPAASGHLGAQLRRDAALVPPGERGNLQRRVDQLAEAEKGDGRGGAEAFEEIRRLVNEALDARGAE